LMTRTVKSALAAALKTFSTRRLTTVALVAAAAMVLVPFASATPLVVGVASLNGTATVTNTTIQFFDNANTANTLSGAASGNTLSYSTLNGLPNAVTINELVGGPYSGPVPAEPGPGTDFATFNTTPTLIDFDLTEIQPGVGTPGACFSDASGNDCTPLVDTTAAGDPWVATCPAGHTCVVSPFSLLQVSGGVDIFLVLDGMAYYNPPGSGPNNSPTIANLSTQGVFETYGGIVEIDNALHTGNGQVNASISATFGSTAIPEPTTALLSLSGLFGVALFYRRRSKSRS